MPKGVPGSGPTSKAGDSGGADWLPHIVEALKALAEAQTYPGVDLQKISAMQLQLQQLAQMARGGGEGGGGMPPGGPPGMPPMPGGMPPGAGMATPPGGGPPGAGGDPTAMLAALGGGIPGGGGALPGGLTPSPQMPGGDELARIMAGSGKGAQ